MKSSIKIWKNSLITLMISLGLVSNLAPITNAEIPPAFITRESGKVKAELSQEKVKVDGHEGWSGFEESPLAEVTFRLKIIRQGKTKFNQILGSVSYRYGNLPQLFKVIDLDRDKEPEIVLRFVGGDGSYKGGFYYLIYRYEPTKNTYTHITIESSGPDIEIKDLDKDGKAEFVGREQKMYLGLCTACEGLPLQIQQYQKGRMINVTRRFPRLIKADAFRLWQEAIKYAGEKYQNESLKGALAGYLADKYLLGQGEEGWRIVKQLYQYSDRETYFQLLRDNLLSGGYISQNEKRYAYYQFRKSITVIDLQTKVFCNYLHFNDNSNILSRGVVVSKNRGIIREQAGYDPAKSNHYWIKNNIRENMDWSDDHLTPNYQFDDGSLIECTKPGGFRRTYKKIVTPEAN
jgi:hypothetical protein